MAGRIISRCARAESAAFRAHNKDEAHAVMAQDYETAPRNLGDAFCVAFARQRTGPPCHFLQLATALGANTLTRAASRGTKSG